MDILLFCIESMMNVFAMIDLWLILYLLFGCDMRVNFRNMAVAGTVFLAGFVAVSILLEGHNSLIMAYMCLYNVGVTIFLCNSHRFRAVLLTIPAVLVYSQFGAFIDLFEKLTGLDRYFIMASDGHMQTSLAMISDMTLCIVLVILTKTRVAKTKSIQLNLWEGIFISVFCIFSPVIMIGLEWFEGLVNAPAYRFVWVVFMIILNVAVVYAIAHRKQATYYRRLSEDYKKEFEEEYLLFRDYKKRQQDTIKFRHDWQNHMLLMQGMMEKGEYEKAESYFRDLTEKMPQSVTKIATGNEMADMVFAAKTGMLQENEIALCYKGDMGPIKFMKQVDCCILLSNLIDNAIEANIKVGKERYIRISAKMTGGLFYLEIANPMTGKLVRSDKKILTTKEDAENHGIGLSNVYDIIASYNGTYRVDDADEEYKIQISFPS